MQYRAIFFDAVGTLIHPEPPAAQVYLQVGRRLGSRRTLDEIAQRFRNELARQDDLDRENGWRTNEGRERRRWRDIVAGVLDDVTNSELSFAELYNHFAQPASWRIDSQAALLMPRLEERGVVLGLASNYDSRLHSVVGGFLLLQRFPHLIISSEVGYRKPATEFFDKIVDVAAVARDRILYVGDNPTDDYDAARAAGLCAFLVTQPGTLQRLPV